MSSELREDAIALIARLVSFDTESSKSNLAIVDCIEEHLRARDVPFTRVPNAKGDFRIGAEKYDQKLKLALSSSLSRQEIGERARADRRRGAAPH